MLKYRTIKILVFSILLNGQLFAQQVTEESAYLVYQNIISAIGNNSPRPPKLEFKNSINNPASFNPFKKKISIETKVLEICYSFGEDSLNAFAYIIAHELAHSYCRHGWHTQFAGLDFSNQIDDNVISIENRIDNETQADIYAGFFSHIAGYDALGVAGSFLENIYNEYQLPDSISGYPSFQERLFIVESNISEFEKLKRVYDSALISFSLGQYDYALSLYELILDQGFTSREIYNNIGLCYVYQALDLKIENGNFDVILPFKLDLDSRLNISGITRDLSNTEDVIYLLNSATDNFKLAVQLSSDYSLAKENIFFTQLALKQLGESVELEYSELEILELNNTCENCIQGINYDLNGKANKSIKFFAKGAKNSCSVCAYNLNIEKQQTEAYDVSFQSNLEYNGFDIYCKDFKSRDCDVFIDSNNSISICYNYFDSHSTTMVKVKNKGDKKCISLIEVLEGSIDHIPKISIGDSSEIIKEEFEKYEIYVSDGSTFYNVKSKRVTYLVKDNLIKAGYYYERID